MQDEQNPLGEADHDELWLMSYADLLTLLIGFFVLLIASSPVKASQFEQIVASISGGAQAPLVGLQGQVEQMIRSAGLSGQVHTRAGTDGLSIAMNEVLLFDSGSALVRAPGQAVVERLAGLLQALPQRPVVVEGYSDDVPIRTAQFQSNWELSAQRAIEVLTALERAGVARHRLSIRSFADTRMVARSGNLEAERAANRRVVIRVE